MFVYWLLFFIPVFFAVIGNKRLLSKNNENYSLHLDPLWLSIIALLTIIIGLRHNVGGDWFAYLRMLRYVDQIQDSFGSDLVYLFGGDAGYLFLNWISVKLGGGIYGVNLLCGFIFSTGLAIFCRNMPRPFLALAVAIPYLVVVVSMGYSRQAVALGVSMIGLVSLSRGRVGEFIFLTLISTLFHKSGIIMLPIAALAASKNKFLSLGLIAIIFAYIYYSFLVEPFELLYKNYIANQDAQSQGAFIRLLMCVFPAMIYLIWPHRFPFKPKERELYKLMCLISLGLFFILIINPNISSAIDRVALYMLPIQLVIFSHVPDMLNDKKITTQLLTLLIIFYYFCVLFIWLNFAVNAQDWIPYSTYLLEFSVETHEIID